MPTTGRTRIVGRRIAWGMTAALGMVVAVFLVGAARASYPQHRLSFSPDPGTWRGVYHVHTQASDGLGTIADVVAAARASGAAWVLVADHNLMEPVRARYEGGVLLLFSPEVSVPSGHVTAVGASRALTRTERGAKNPLATIRAVGGAPVAAHPLGRKRPYLHLDDPQLAGLEILSADQEFRDALVSPARFLPAALAYLVNPLDAMMRLLQRPDRTLARWDDLLRSRRTAGFCAVDAHGRPPYAAMMEGLQMYAAVGHPPTNGAAADGAALFDALIAGRTYCGIETIGAAGGFRFGATSDAGEVSMGDETRLDLHPVLHLDLAYEQLPPVTRPVLICGGVEVPLDQAPAKDGLRSTYRPTRPGACRAEVRVDGDGHRVLPWIMSNPVYVR